MEIDFFCGYIISPPADDDGRGSLIDHNLLHTCPNGPDNSEM